VKASAPQYPADIISELVRARWYTLKPDAWRFFVNREYDAAEAAHEVLTILPASGRFAKTVQLRDGRLADVYRVGYDGWDLYVKLYVVAEGDHLVVMSCKP
jgi:hypothetical protein